MKPVVLIVMTLVVVGAMVAYTGLQVAPTADSVKLMAQESCRPGMGLCVTDGLAVQRTDQFMVTQSGRFTGASFKILDSAGSGTFSCRLNVDVTWSPGDGYSRRGEATFTFSPGTAWYTVPAFSAGQILLNKSVTYTIGLSVSFCDGSLLGWYREELTSEHLYDVWGILPPTPGQDPPPGGGPGPGTSTECDPAVETCEPPPPVTPVTPGFDALLVVAAVLLAFTLVLIKRR